MQNLGINAERWSENVADWETIHSKNISEVSTLCWVFETQMNKPCHEYDYGRFWIWEKKETWDGFLDYELMMTLKCSLAILRTE